jgi:23S rRNA pseudouridine1911/1915/1917 synthase
MLKKTIYIENSDENCRLDFCLSNLFPDFSRSKIQNAIKNSKILVNHSPSKPSYSVRENDRIDILIEDSEDIIIKPQNINLDIRYEDDDILVVNKPKNMLTHPTMKEQENTLVNALLNRYGYEGLSNLNGCIRPGIVHRLDRNTSGLLMIAKNNLSHDFLSEQIRTKTAIRKYLAVVSGTFQEDTGTVNAPIARHKTKCEKFTVIEGGKPSVTHYTVLERFSRYSLLELQLETGRTHQIRVHMSYIGHAIVNDSLYGGEKIKVNTTEQVLQAYKLSFFNMKNEKVDIEICSDDDINRVLHKLRSER